MKPRVLVAQGLGNRLSTRVARKPGSQLRPAHRIELACPGALAVTWVHRDEAAPGERDRLLRAVEAIDLPTGRLQVFVHGEAGEVRAVRRHLLGERGIPKAGTSISPYWRRNHSDEQWREIKAAWLAEADHDVPAAAS